MKIAVRRILSLVVILAGCHFGILATATTLANSSTQHPAKTKKGKASSTAKAGSHQKSRQAQPYYAPVRVSASVRSAALRQVSEQIESTPQVALEQPESLDYFFTQLEELDDGQGERMVHILQFGDSHTAADEFTGKMRSLFQERFGNGGAGYSYAGHLAGYRYYGTKRGQSEGWAEQGNHFVQFGDGFFGLGGISISTDQSNQNIFLEAPCVDLKLQYLQQPGGGLLAFFDNGNFIQFINTNGPLAPGDFSYACSEVDDHNFEVWTLTDLPVRLFGWVTEKPGVTYESMGINGAEAALILRWDEVQHSTYLQRRDPSLIVLAYGTNEAGDTNWSYDNYRGMFTAVVARLRRAAPNASILVIGPADRYYRVKRRYWKPMDAVDRIIAAQRDTCRQIGCTFWDQRARMGGYGSMRQWVNAGWAQPDNTHFTAEGYSALAEALYSDLTRQYEIFKKQHVQTRKQYAIGHPAENH